MRPVHTRPASRWRMICGYGGTLAAVWCVWLAASVAAANDGDAALAPVIPPGEEAVIADMLGRGKTLPHCTLVSGGVEFNVITATYSCIYGNVTIALDHRRNATANSTQTGQFAVTIQSGSPPPGFADALTTLVRSQEGSFEWRWPERDAPVPAEDDDAE